MKLLTPPPLRQRLLRPGAATRNSQRGWVMAPYRYAAGSGSPEPTFSNISLLIHCDARPFVDSSPNKFPVANRGRRVTTSGGLAVFPGSGGGQGLRVPINAAFSFGMNGAFTLCAKVKTDGFGARIFDTRTDSGATDGWNMNIQAATNAPFLQVAGTTYGIGTPVANLTLTAGVLTEVSFSYDGSVLRCFVGGALSWSHTVSLTLTAATHLMIGNTNTSDGTATANQSLAEVMIVKGEAVYTAAYTPASRQSDTGTVIESYDPASYSNVKLNLHGAGANGGTTFTDTSSGGRTVSAFGNVQTSTAQASIGSSSILFDGTGDYLTVPQSSDFAFGTDAFSFESLVRPTSVTGIRVIAATYADSSNGWLLQNNISMDGDANWNNTGDGVNLTSGFASCPINTWTHVAITRATTASGGLELMFMDGELVNFTLNTESITATVAVYIGRMTTIVTTRDWTGYMQEIRVVKGEQVYPRSFLLPTAAHPDS